MKALLVSLAAIVMGGLALYVTSGVTLTCRPGPAGHATCTEGRRVLGLIDVPLRELPEVLGAEWEETSMVNDGRTVRSRRPLMLTPGGREPFLFYGVGADFFGVVSRLDAYARDPEPAGLRVGGQAGGMAFVAHLFALLFVVIGLSVIGAQVKAALRRDA